MRFKYPRTYHTPFTESTTSDDKILDSMDHFEGKYVVITEKRDGENTTISRDYHHARSIDSKDHESRHWIKRLWSEIRYNIPKNMRICGENLYARHSIPYEELTSYFEVFSIWERETCLSWNETLEYCQLLDLTPVPVLYHGIYSNKVCLDLIKNIDKTRQEGFVIRVEDSFNYYSFDKSIAKYVRQNHVQTTTHWQYAKIITNKLKI